MCQPGAWQEQARERWSQLLGTRPPPSPAASRQAGPKLTGACGLYTRFLGVEGSRPVASPSGPCFLTPGPSPHPPAPAQPSGSSGAALSQALPVELAGALDPTGHHTWASKTWV